MGQASVLSVPLGPASGTGAGPESGLSPTGWGPSLRLLVAAWTPTWVPLLLAQHSGLPAIIAWQAQKASCTMLAIRPIQLRILPEPRPALCYHFGILRNSAPMPDALFDPRPD